MKNKEKVVFYVETTEGISLGGVYMNKITKVAGKIGDGKCFLFSNKSGAMKKFPINPARASDALKICSRFDQDLFIFGNDLTVSKEGTKNRSNVNEKGAIFTYTSRNAMTGKIGTFDIKRLLVIQLE